MYSFKRSIAALLFAVFMVCVPLYVFDKLDGKVAQAMPSYQGVLTLWHVDGFEGGSGSRAEFLKGRAIEFEAKNKGVLVSVQTYTAEQVVQKLAEGDKFDMISFSAGVGDEVRQILSPYTGNINVRDDLLQGGMIGSDVYALPWAFGGYMLCAFDDVLQKTGKTLSVDEVFNCGYTKKDKYNTKVPSLGIGFAQYNNPFEVLVDSGVKGDSGAWTNDLSLTSYQAYQGFLDKKFAVLLGTQRDLSRLSLRQSQGKLEPTSFVYMQGFTDLVQYIGFCDNGDGRGVWSQQFMQYLTSDDSQKKLTKIEMFSPALDIYSSGMQADMQRALSDSLRTTNAFTDKNILQQQKTQSMAKVGI